MSEDTVVTKPGTYPDPDRFLAKAKELVRDNYNEHHASDDIDPPLVVDDLYIVWFTKVLSSWRAQVQSTVVRGLLWMVTFNGPKNDAYIEVFRKINNTSVKVKQP